MFCFQWFERSYGDPFPLSEDISSTHFPITPLLNVEESVWFEEYAHDLNIDGDQDSSEETWQEARSHYEEVFIPYG